MGGKGKTDIDTSYLKDAIALGREQFGLAKELWGITKPAQQAVTTQALETLRGGPTGQIGAIAPLISRSVEAHKRAAGQQQAQAAEEMARYGLTGTPFGQNILQSMAQEAAFQESQISPQMAYDFYNKMLGLLLPMSVNQAPVAMQGMGQGAGTAVQGGSSLADIQQRARQSEMGLFSDIFRTVYSSLPGHSG
jgi:hypothetical protein